MRKKSTFLRLIYVAFIFFLLLSLCCCRNQKKKVDQVEINSKEMRIVSLSPSVTNILQQLGLQSSIVAVANSKISHPSIQNLGNYGPVSSERESEIRKKQCLKLNPSVIFTHDYSFTLGTTKSFASIVREVDTKVSNVSDLMDLIDIVAEETSMQKKAVKLKEYIQWSLLELRLNLREVAAKSYLVLLNQNPIQVLGPGSFLSSTIELYILGNNVAPGFQSVIELQKDDIKLLSPDIIIDLSESNYLRNPIRAFVPPDRINIKKGKVEWLIPSGNVVQSMRDIATILHPNEL